MRARASLIAAGLLAAALPASAQANIYQRVESIYERDGTVPACLFTSAQLTTTLKEVDNYGGQYVADFTNAVQAARVARASGDCSRGALAARKRLQGPIPPEGSLPASVTSPTSAGVPGPILLLGILAILAGLGGGLFALLRATGRNPRWAAASSHAFAEAGYRLGGRWENLRDRWRS